MMAHFLSRTESTQQTSRVNKIKKKGQNSREIAAAQLRPTGRSTCGTLPPHTIGALSEA
jgi:hypothetical protein